MGKIEKQRFEVYLLDMYEDEYGDWQENERHMLGHLTVIPVIGSEIDARDILDAMRRFSYPDLVGRKIRALDTVDQRRVYAEDPYGSGTWWEVGTVKGHMPVYGLRLMEEAV